MMTPHVAPDQEAAPWLGAVWAGRLAVIFKYTMVLFAIAYIVEYIVLAGMRMPYPYELEWMEGGMVDHMRWILSGKPLYVEPSLTFIPNIYGPLYPYLGAAMCKIMGIGFFAPRLLSFVSSLGCLALVGMFVGRQTGSWIWALSSTAILAASYRVTGAWMDIARVDSLALVLALSSLYVLRFRWDTKSIAIAGLVMGLSFLAKQSALFIAAPLVLYTLVMYTGWRRYTFAVVFLGFVGLTTVLFDAATDGWYTYYLFHLPSTHHFLQIMWFGFWWMDIGKNLAVALAMTIFALLLGKGRKDVLFYGMAIAGLLGSSWVSRLHVGGYDNVLLPAAAAMAMGFGLGAAALQSAIGSEAEPSAGPQRDQGRGGMAVAALYLVATWQLLILAYPPKLQVPSNLDRRSGDAMIQKLATLDADINMMEHGFLATLAGSDTFHAHGSAIWDVLQTDDEISRKLRNELREAIVARKFQVLVRDETRREELSYWKEMARRGGGDHTEWERDTLLDLCMEQIEANYTCIGHAYTRDGAGWPVTGVALRPGCIYVPKGSPLASRKLK